MSDHFDAPDLNSPNMDARVDICDIFAFRKPEDTGKTVLVFDVNPLAPTIADSFDPEAVYELKLDTNGDAVANDNASVQSAAARARVPSARASIEGSAFSNSSGAVMVNQSAGAGNLQRNSVLLGTAAPGVETVSDGVLSATAANNGGQSRAVAVQGVREAGISGDAFRNVNGIVQINQTAGAGNATANSFVLRPPAGTLFN